MAVDKMTPVLACVSHSLMGEIDAARTDSDDLKIGITHIHSPPTLLDSHAHTPFDYLILEDGLEGFTSDTIIQPIRGQFDIRPIIVIGAPCDARAVTQLIRAGADDYLIRDDLSARILRESMRFAKEAELRRKSERDIRQVIAQLRASDNFAQMLIDQSSDMIVAVDLALRITEFNRAAEHAFGYAREDMIGQHVSILYANPDQAWPVRMQTFKSGFVGEVCNRRKSGEEFVSALHSCKVVDTHGELVGVIGISREIITGQSADNKLRTVHEQLIQRTDQLNRRECHMIEIERTCCRIVSNLIDLAADCNNKPAAVAEVDKVLSSIRAEFKRQPDDATAPESIDSKSIHEWFADWCELAKAHNTVTFEVCSMPTIEWSASFVRVEATLNRLLDALTRDTDLAVVVAEPQWVSSGQDASLVILLTVSGPPARRRSILNGFASEPRERSSKDMSDLLFELQLLTARRFAVASGVVIHVEPMTAGQSLVLRLAIEDGQRAAPGSERPRESHVQTSLIG